MRRLTFKTQTAAETPADPSNGLGMYTQDQLDELGRRSESRRGNFAITDQSISGTSTFETNQSLTESDWEWGYMFLWLPNDADITAQHRRKSMFLVFTKDHTEAVCQAAQVNFQTFTINSIVYNFYEWWYKAYRYDEDGFLSSNDYDESGANIRLDSVRIDGSNLEIIFRNTSGSTQQLTINGEWRVFRSVEP